MPLTHSRLISLCVLCVCLPATAADWPQWGGRDNRNQVSEEKNLPDTFTPGTKDPQGNGIDLSTTQNVRWVARLGGAAYGNPTVAAGRVFVGTDDLIATLDPRLKRTKGGMVKCFDEATGKLLWQLVVPQRNKLPKGVLYRHQDLGVCSSPLVDGDRVYVVTCAAEVLCLDVHGQAGGNRGPFREEAQYMAGEGEPPIALQETDADILWRYDLIDDLGIRPHDVTACSILVHGDCLYLSTSNGVDQPHLNMLAPNVPAIIALDKRTGRLVAAEHEGISSRVFHCQWSSPSLGKVGDKTLIFFGGGDGTCYAFEALESVPQQPVPLKKVWSFDCIPPEYQQGDGSRKYYMRGDKRKKDSPNRNDGSYVGPSEIIGTPVFLDGRVYVAIGQDPAHGRGRGMFWCIDATGHGDITRTGCVWRYDGLDRTISTPAVADGLAYIVDIAGRLHCVNAATGKPCWVYESGAEAWGGPLLADSKLFFGNIKGLCVMETGRTAKVLSKISLGSAVYSTPIAANGTLYVASQKYLWAVRKP